MKPKRIQFISPEFPSSDDLVADYEAIHKNNWYTNFGPYEQKFSKSLAEYIGNETSVATVSNATTGLMIAMLNLFPAPTEKRNEVIMPSFTFAAGANSLILLGYTPVFIDIDSHSLQPQLEQAEAYIESHQDSVAGVLFCNVFGVGAPEISEWEEMCEKHSLALIIDSAAGFGSKYENDELLGSRGDCEVFSFHATKPFAVGEGGAISSRNSELILRMKESTNFGFNKTRVATHLGFNAKLQELNCAIGLRQLETINETIRKRQKILKAYQDSLDGKYVFQQNDNKSSVAFASILAPTHETADLAERELHKDSIEVHRYYNPHLFQHEFIREKSKIAFNLNNTEDICSRILSLPVHKEVSEDSVVRIAKVLNSLK